MPGYALSVSCSHHRQNPALLREQEQIAGYEGVALVHQHICRSGGDLAKFGDHLADDIGLGDAVNIYLFLAPAKGCWQQGPDQPDLVQKSLGRLNGRQHLRAGFDSQLLAHLSLDVSQKPLHQEEIELSAAEKLTDLA